MKNFKKKNLYENESGLFDAVIDGRIETHSEYNRVGRYRVGNEEEDEDVKIIDSGLDFNTFDDSGFGGFDDLSFHDSFGSINSDSTDPQSLPHDEWKRISPVYMRVLTAPLWAIVYLYRGMLYDNPFKSNKKEDESDSGNSMGFGDGSTDANEGNEQDRILIQNYRVASLIVGLLSFIELTGLINILIPPLVGIVAIAISVYCDFYLEKNYNKGIIIQMVHKLKSDEEEESDNDFTGTTTHNTNQYESFEEDDSFGERFGSSRGRSERNDPFAGFDGFGNDDGAFDLDVGDYIEEDDSQEEDNDPEAVSNKKIQQLFPDSPINTKGSAVEFGEGLLEVFKSQNNQKGKIPRTRKQLMPSYAPFLPSNDKAFANWYDLKERSVEYNNIAFTLYKVLTQINGKFDISNTSTDKLTIMNMQRSPLLYKIEVKLPTYFREAQVLKSAGIVENFLKDSDNDVQVGCIITTFGGNYIFKFMRLDYRGLISHGDIMRYEDPLTGVATVDLLAKDKGLPVLMGMKDNEYPYVFDLEDNTSGAIVGGSGSGKSWLTFQLMMNLLTLNTPEELNLLILDAKDAALWKQFAKAPHVLGYHTNIYEYMKILTEVQEEHLRRAAFLSSIGVEDFKTYREMCKEKGDYEALAKHPFLVVVMDEITYTMKQLRLHDKDAYDEFRATLSSLATVVRSSGIRILAIGQRAIDTSIPKDYMSNATMKFAMKMDNATEFDIMVNKGWEKHVSRKPVNAGESLMLTQGQAQPQYVKTLIPGGTSTQTMLQLIRVISLDWVRRTIGTNIDYMQPPELMRDTLKLAFNRPDFYTNALQDLHEGRILTSTEVNEGAQVNINPGEDANTVSRFGVSSQTQVLTKEELNPIHKPSPLTTVEESESDDPFNTSDIFPDFDDWDEDDELSQSTQEPSYSRDSDPFGSFNDIEESTRRESSSDVYVDSDFEGNLQPDSETIKEQEFQHQTQLEQALHQESISEPVYPEPLYQTGDDTKEIKSGIKEAIDSELEETGKQTQGLAIENSQESLEEVNNLTLEDFLTDKQEDVSQEFGSDLNTEFVSEIESDEPKDEGKTDTPYTETAIQTGKKESTGNTGDSKTGKPTISKPVLKKGKLVAPSLRVNPVIQEPDISRSKDELFPNSESSKQRVTGQTEPKPVQEQEDWVKQAQQKHKQAQKKQQVKKRVTQVGGHEVVKASQEMPYKKTSPVQSGVKPSIKQFIIKQGIKVGPFTRAVTTDLLRANYTPREIDIALSNLIIYIEGGYYVTDIS